MIIATRILAVTSESGDSRLPITLFALTVLASSQCRCGLAAPIVSESFTPRARGGGAPSGADDGWSSRSAEADRATSERRAHRDDFRRQARASGDRRDSPNR
jgi:hypothetical protein